MSAVYAEDGLRRSDPSRLLHIGAIPISSIPASRATARSATARATSTRSLSTGGLEGPEGIPGPRATPGPTGPTGCPATRWSRRAASRWPDRPSRPTSSVR